MRILKRIGGSKLEVRDEIPDKLKRGNELEKNGRKEGVLGRKKKLFSGGVSLA